VVVKPFTIVIVNLGWPLIMYSVCLYVCVCKKE